MFGRRRQKPEVSLLTPELIQSIAVAFVETTAKQEAAVERWGIGTSDRWSADLAAGSISFHFDDHTITGPVEFLGSHSTETETWLWGWANGGIPEAVRGASARVRDWGAERIPAMAALTTEKLNAPATLGDDFAALTVELAELAGYYRAPTATGYVWLGFTEFARVEGSSDT